MADEPVKLASPKPIRKLRFGAAVGACVVIFVWLLRAIWKVEVPAEIAAAMTVVASSAAAYFTHSEYGDVTPSDPV